MRTTLRGLATVMAVCCMPACGVMVGIDRPDQVELSVDGRSNAHVTLAADGRRLAAAWVATSDAGADVFVAVSDDAGRRFGAPVRVNDIPGDASGNGEQPPRVLLTDRGVSVVWVSKREGVSGIRAAQSGDGGRTFPAARTISPDGVTGARGWESATIDEAGVVHAAWLDGRNAQPSPAASGPATAGQARPAAPGHTHAHGDMRQDIVHAMWRGDDAVVESPVADNVCFCCKTGVAAHGRDVFVVWRHLFPGGVRDIAIARSADGGRTFSSPVRVSADDWKIDACPDDGPALAIAADGAIHVVWPTLLQDGGTPHMAIFEAVSRDGGATFSPRARVDASATGASHPRVAVSRDGARAVVWDEPSPGGRRVMALTAGTPAPLADGGSASYPAIAASGAEFAVAWTEQAEGRSIVRLARIAR